MENAASPPPPLWMLAYQKKIRVGEIGQNITSPKIKSLCARKADGRKCLLAKNKWNFQNIPSILKYRTSFSQSFLYRSNTFWLRKSKKNCSALEMPQEIYGLINVSASCHFFWLCRVPVTGTEALRKTQGTERTQESIQFNPQTVMVGLTHHTLLTLLLTFLPFFFKILSRRKTSSHLCELNVVAQKRKTQAGSKLFVRPQARRRRLFAIQHNQSHGWHSVLLESRCTYWMLSLIRETESSACRMSSQAVSLGKRRGDFST